MVVVVGAHVTLGDAGSLMSCDKLLDRAPGGGSGAAIAMDTPPTRTNNPHRIELRVDIILSLGEFT